MELSLVDENHERLIKEELIDLLTLKKEGHLTHRIYYSNDGSDPYNACLENQNYYAFNTEKLLIDSLVKDVLPNFFLNEVSIIEIGPGSELAIKNKTFKFIEALKTVSYHALDQEVRYTRLAAHLVERNFPHLKVESKSFNLLDTAPPYKIASTHPMLVLLLGGSHASFNDEEIINSFDNVKKIIGAKEFYMVFSLDCNQDKHSILNAYSLPESESLILRAMKFYKDKLSLNDLDLNFLRSYIKFDKASHTVKGCIVSEKDQFIEIDGKKITIVKGKEYNISISRKFTPNKVEFILKNINCELITKLDSNNATLNLFLIKLNT